MCQSPDNLTVPKENKIKTKFSLYIYKQTSKDQKKTIWTPQPQTHFSHLPKKTLGEKNNVKQH